MKNLVLKTPSGESVITTSCNPEKIGKITGSPDTFTITDSNVYKHYSHYLQGSSIAVIEPGEKNKTLQTVERLYTELLKAGIDRSSRIVGVGGGIVTDITGYTASTFMRGVKFGFISTTLLGCIDASVGGKNGVNFKGFKNMIGQFAQPEFVHCATGCFKTLEEAELHNGFAEAIKHGAIASAEYLDFIDRNIEKARQLSPDIVAELIHRSVLIKASIVEKDEKESGLRKILNFGHTIGHAIEKIRSVPHGTAVAMGMVAAAGISERTGLLSSEDFSYIKDIISRAGLPTDTDIKSLPDLTDVLYRDKKKSGDKISFILLKKPGEPVIQSMSLKEIRSIINDL